MSERENAEWNGTIKLLHWLVFVLVIAIFVAVNVAQSYEWGSPERLWWVRLHLSFGLTAMVVMLGWLAARARFGRPARPGSPWQVRLAAVAHWGMVALVIAMPLAGSLMILFSGHPVVIYFLFSIPAFLPENEALSEAIFAAHTNVGAPLFFLLILLHIAGALWHHFIDRDDTLKRMLPRP